MRSASRTARHARDQCAADRILTRKVVPGKRLVHDDDVRHASAVALVEIAPGTNRDPERFGIRR